MIKKKSILSIRNILNIFFFKFSFLFLTSFCLFLKFNYEIAFSGFLGGLVSIVSSFLFLMIFLYDNKNLNPKFIIRKFYFAGFLKFVFLILFVIICFYIGIYSPFYFFLFFFIIHFFSYFYIFYIFMEI